MRNAGVKVNGIWAQDWSGIRMTSFGKRVMWNWKWNSDNYPQLDSRIKQWKEEGVQFLSYINPYVASDKDLCAEAAKHGYGERRHGRRLSGRVWRILWRRGRSDQS